MATQVLLLDNNAFGYMVAENKLDTWEGGGYIYAGKREPSGEMQLYRTYGPKWRMQYTARRVATQANAAGGAVIIDITVATGIVGELVSVRGQNSGNNGLYGDVVDEDNAIDARFFYVGAAGGNIMAAPNAANAGTATGNLTDAKCYKLGPGKKLSVYQTAAGAQNDTLTVAVTLLLPITAAESDVSWSVARSTNPANVTLAASTISAANTMQAVLLP